MNDFEKPVESTDGKKELATLIKGMLFEVNSLSANELRTVQSKLSINIEGEKDSNLPDEEIIRAGLRGIIESTPNMSEAERIVAAIELAKQRTIDEIDKI